MQNTHYNMQSILMKYFPDAQEAAKGHLSIDAISGNDANTTSPTASSEYELTLSRVSSGECQYLFDCHQVP